MNRHHCSCKSWSLSLSVVAAWFTGTLSEDGLLVYLRVLQAFLAQLPVSAAGTSCQDSASDSEDESEETDKQPSTPVSSGPCQGSDSLWAPSADVGSPFNFVSFLVWLFVCFFGPYPQHMEAPG